MTNNTATTTGTSGSTTTTALLRAVPLFDELDDDELEIVATVGEQRSVPAGETVFEQGTGGHGLVVMVDGAVDIVRDGETVGTIDAPGFFGEGAVLTHRPRSAAVHALTDAELLYLSGPRVSVLLATYPDVLAKIEQADVVRT